MDVVVLNSKFESIAVIDTFKSLIWVDRYNAYGDFELYLAINSEVLPFQQLGYYLWNKESEHCMIIETIAIDSNVEDGNYSTISGRSLESILDRRIIWGQKQFKGSLEQAIKQMLTDAFISPTIPERKLDNFVFQESNDPVIQALEIDTQYTGENLYEVIKGLCEENHIGFKIILNDENQFVFSLYSGVDRSYAQSSNPFVIFSPKYENIINSNYFSSSQNLKNVTLVAGEGEGAARKTVIVGSESGLERRELFTDARDISSTITGGTLTAAQYNQQLEGRGTKNLSSFILQTAFEGEVEATRLFKYGEDFFMGDIVQIANEYGHEGSAYISEIIHSQDETGISVYPTFQIRQKEGE